MPSTQNDFEAARLGVFATPGLPLRSFELRNSGSNRYAPSALGCLKSRRPAAKFARPAITHLEALESESIHILREVAAECGNPALLLSEGKDSVVVLRLPEKAFAPPGFLFHDRVFLRRELQGLTTGRYNPAVHGITGTKFTVQPAGT